MPQHDKEDILNVRIISENSNMLEVHLEKGLKFQNLGFQLRKSGIQDNFIHLWR